MHRIAFAIALFVIAGCSLGNVPTPRATYAPVPDAILYQSLAQIPGVARVDVGWTNGFDNANGYGGTIYARRGADEVDILDRALAILRQGRPSAYLGAIEVARPDAFVIFASDVGLWTPADFTARYGPQPGTGVPPPNPLKRVR